MAPMVKKKKKSACLFRRHKRWNFDLWVRKIPWRRKWQPTPVFLSGKSHGQRRLVGYNPRGHKRVGHDLVTKQLAKYILCPYISITVSCHSQDKP